MSKDFLLQKGNEMRTKGFIIRVIKNSNEVSFVGYKHTFKSDNIKDAPYFERGHEAMQQARNWKKYYPNCEVDVLDVETIKNVKSVTRVRLDSNLTEV